MCNEAALIPNGLLCLPDDVLKMICNIEYETYEEINALNEINNFKREISPLAITCKKFAQLWCLRGLNSNILECIRSQRY